MKYQLQMIALVLLANGLAANAQSKRTSVIINNEANKVQEEYWTEDRIKNAIPLPDPEVSKEQLKKLLGASAVAKKIPGNVQSVEGSDIKSLTPGVPEKANVSERPFWNGGVLFFTKPDGKDYLCSAQFTGQNNIILTAAHCVRDGQTGAWYKNFNFRRAYNNGGGQSVGWKCAAAYYMWYTPPNNYKYDYAFIQASTTSGAGWLGWKTQIPYTTFTAIGYPKNYGDNKYMYKVQGGKGTVSGGIVQMTNNPMRSGNSGGAWIAELTTPIAAGNYAVGLNSFHTSDTTSEYGPLFDDQFVGLYNLAVNNCKQ